MSTYELTQPVRNFISSGPKKLLIDGEWGEAAAGAVFATHDPATGEKVTDVAHGTAEDVNRAVAAARAPSPRARGAG